MRPLWLALLACLGLVGPAAADGLFYRLPEDGVFAGYVAEITFSVKGEVMTGRGNVTMSSVGQVTIEGKKCRWLEIKFAMTMNEQENTQLFKVLVPEEHLKAGASPMEHALKGWVKRDNGEPTEIKDFKSGDTPLPMFLGGPLKDAKKLDKAVTPSKLGKLECEGVKGSYALQNRGEQITAILENRLHDKAPFGLVTSNMQFTVERNGQVDGTGTMTFRLVATGKDAKSELPDHK